MERTRWSSRGSGWLLRCLRASVGGQASGRAVRTFKIAGQPPVLQPCCSPPCGAAMDKFFASDVPTLQDFITSRGGSIDGLLEKAQLVGKCIMLAAKESLRAAHLADDASSLTAAAADLDDDDLLGPTIPSARLALPQSEPPPPPVSLHPHPQHQQPCVRIDTAAATAVEKSEAVDTPAEHPSEAVGKDAEVGGGGSQKRKAAPDDTPSTMHSDKKLRPEENEERNAADLSSAGAAAAAVQMLPLFSKNVTDAAASSSAPPDEVFQLCEMSTKDLEELQIHIKRLGTATTVPASSGGGESTALRFSVGQYSFGIAPELLVNNLIGARTSIGDVIGHRNRLDHMKSEVAQGMGALRHALHIEQGLRTNDVINFQQQLSMWYQFYTDYEKQQQQQKAITEQLTLQKEKAEQALATTKTNVERLQTHITTAKLSFQQKQQQLQQLQQQITQQTRRETTEQGNMEVVMLKTTIARLQTQIQALVQVPQTQLPPPLQLPPTPSGLNR